MMPLSICMLIACGPLVATGYYWCKGTNMTDPQAAATKIRMGVVTYGIAMTLIFLGTLIILGKVAGMPNTPSMSGQFIEVVVDMIFVGFMGYYVWNAAVRFQGNRMVIAPTNPGQRSETDPYSSRNLINQQ